MPNIELPKQWRKWCRKAGLRTSYDSKMDRHSPYGGGFYMKGHGRHWRVDCEGYLDVSEPFETFDRWANSLVRSVPMTAKNEREFLELVVSLLPIDKRRAFRKRHGMYSAMTMAIMKARPGCAQPRGDLRYMKPTHGEPMTFTLDFNGVGIGVGRSMEWPSAKVQVE